MLKDFFPVKLILSPAEVFAEIAAGKTGWGWPLALYAASILSSALLLSLVPAAFLAAAAPDFPAAAGLTFWGYLGAGLPGGLAFAFFFCALLRAFSGWLKSGRLMLRLPVPAAGVAAYAFFFMLKIHARGGGAAGWLAAAAALVFALRSARPGRREYPALLKAFLAISLFTLISNLAGGAAALSGSPQVYRWSEYLFAFLSITWLTKAVMPITGTTAARAFTATVPALLGAAAFFFSLFALGALSSEVLQVLFLL